MRIAPICSLLLILIPALVPAQYDPMTAPVATAETDTSTSVAAPKIDPAKREAALAFLRRVEKKNSETKTLSASFTQQRVDKVFGDEVSSEGQLWYRSDGRFRASYRDENPSELWMTGDKLYNYVPTIRQVDVVTLETGAKAPIHQMLLGFGAQVDKILEVFDVSTIPAGKGQVAIQFDSKDPGRSMEFTRIAIRFDEGKMEPRTIIAEDDSNTITVSMKDIRFNPKIDEKTFEPKWPDGVEVVEHGKAQQ